MKKTTFIAVVAFLSFFVNVNSVQSAKTPDRTPPTVPTGLTATSISSSQINLSWNASTDNVGVAGYKVFRNGSQIAATVQTSYTDSGLQPSTTYSYTVSAYDAAGNNSAQSPPVLGVTMASAPSTSAYPVKVGPTGRYLVDQNNVPFMIVGDSPQSLIVNLSETEADAYFADRQSNGFNSAWINLLCDTYTGGRSNGSTYDGIAPFTTPGDLSTPNPAYFQRVDDMINLAAKHNITVFLDPIETGGWLAMLESNGATKDYNYGLYLGTRYKNFPNIVWLNGNDFQTWTNPTDDADVTAVADGIKAEDPNHIQTVELNYGVSSSLDDPRWAPIVSLNAAYTYYPTYAEVLHAYNQSASVPAFMVEANYEFENNTGLDYGSPATLRLQEYWTMLSGATGQLYGNHYTWTFLAGWQSYLDTPGVAQLQCMTALFAPRPWYNLVPDQSHTVVTGGYGTFSSTGSLGSNNYLTAARTPDGSLVMAYMPTIRTITVDMSNLSGAATAQWYDPSNGTFRAIAGSPFPNTGTQQFTPPGNNNAGAGDWVLVLEASSSSGDTQAPTTPTGLTATSVSSSQINLSWTASTDNVGVAGYLVFRNNVQIASTTQTSYSDTGLAPSTSYTYTVVAYDAAGNVSPVSSPATATTLVSTGASTPAFVQSAAFQITSGASVSVAFTNPNTSGNLIVAYVIWDNSGLVSLSDNQGNTYVSAVGPTKYSGDKTNAQVFYAKNVLGGSNRLTATFGTAITSWGILYIHEYSGIDQTNPTDATIAASGSSASMNSGSVTTKNAAELLFGAGESNNTVTSAGAGYTVRSSAYGNITEDQIVTTTGSYNAAAIQNGNAWIMQMATFKAAGQ
jgi:chitodextrinase